MKRLIGVLLFFGAFYACFSQELKKLYVGTKNNLSPGMGILQVTVQQGAFNYYYINSTGEAEEITLSLDCDTEGDADLYVGNTTNPLPQRENSTNYDSDTECVDKTKCLWKSESFGSEKLVFDASASRVYIVAVYGYLETTYDLTLLVTVKSGACDKSSSIAKSNCDVLSEFYAACGGGTWRINSDMYTYGRWMLESNDPCSWTGIQCNDTTNAWVTHIILPNEEMACVVPTSLLNLRELKVLVLTNGKVHGVPLGLFSMNSLESIDLSGNLLGYDSGVSEKSIFDLGSYSFEKIANFSLARNGLKGPIPGWFFGSMKTVQKLDLSGNYFDGNLDTKVSDMSNLVELRLSNNLFTGYVPSSFGSIPTLRSLYIDNNFFEGEIPTFILSNSSKLVVVDLSYNQFSMDLTTINALPLSLRSLNISNNDFWGQLPPLLFSIPTIQDLLVANNRLNTMLSPSISNFQTLKILDLHSNSFYGRIPNSIQLCTRLTYLHLGSNRFEGSIPEAIGDFSMLTYLNMSNNLLSGPIPQSISQLKNLVYLDLFLNKLDGNLPTGIWDSLALIHVNVSYNFLGGFIDPTIGLAKNLKNLDLRNNNIGGELPNTLHSLTSLEKLILSGNNIGGTIEPKIYALTKLSFWDMSWNRISGPIPAIRNMTALTHIDFSHNRLNGSAALDFSRMALEYINLESNMFTGDVPTFGQKGTQYPTNTDTLKYLNVFNNLFDGKLPDYFLPNLEILSAGCSFLSQPLTFQNPTLASSRRPLQSLVYFDVGNNRLTGGFPTELNNAPKLRHLYIQSNHLSGSIRIANFTDLQSLDVSNNQFSGVLPVDIFGLVGLSELNVAGNQFSGELSYDVFLKGVMPSVTKRVDFSYNQFTGYIPDSLKRLSMAYALRFNDNDFIGQLPSDLTQLSGVTTLDVRNNRLIGLVPATTRSMTSLRKLFLGGNQLNRNASSDSLLYLQDLEWLDFSRNNMMGRLPQLSKINEKLKYVWLHQNSFNTSLDDLWNSLNDSPVLELRLQGNRLNEVMPRNASYMPSLVHADLSNNQLFGNITTRLSSVPNLEVLNLASNAFTGIQPVPLSMQQTDSNLLILHLESNQLTDQMPLAISYLRNLECLFSYSNYFTSELPQSMSDMKLKVIDLHDNLFSGAFPGALATLNKAVYIDTSNNQLTSFEGSNSTMPHLKYLQLSKNRIMSALPSNMSFLSSTMHFDVSENNITGTLPSSFDLFLDLVSLDISKNSFSGQFPDLPHLFDIHYLDASTNMFRGEVPPFFANMTILANLAGNPFGCPLPNYTSIIWSANCVCPAGFTADDKLLECRQCLPGTFSVESLNGDYMTVCTKCSPGYYQDRPSQDSCLACQPGYFTEGEASTVCQICPPGSAAPEHASAACTTCPSGTFMNKQGGRECLPCPPGSYSDAGSDLCTQCPINWYQPYPGLDRCLECPKRSLTFTIGSTSIFDCVCPQGLIGLPGGPCFNWNSTFRVGAVLFFVVFVYAVYKHHWATVTASQRARAKLLQEERKRLSDPKKIASETGAKMSAARMLMRFDQNFFTNENEEDVLDFEHSSVNTLDKRVQFDAKIETAPQLQKSEYGRSIRMRVEDEETEVNEAYLGGSSSPQRSRAGTPAGARLSASSGVGLLDDSEIQVFAGSVSGGMSGVGGSGGVLEYPQNSDVGDESTVVVLYSSELLRESENSEHAISTMKKQNSFTAKLFGGGGKFFGGGGKNDFPDKSKPAEFLPAPPNSESPILPPPPHVRPPGPHSILRPPSEVPRPQSVAWNRTETPAYHPVPPPTAFSAEEKLRRMVTTLKPEDRRVRAREMRTMYMMSKDQADENQTE